MSRLVLVQDTLGPVQWTHHSSNCRRIDHHPYYRNRNGEQRLILIFDQQYAHRIPVPCKCAMNPFCRRLAEAISKTLLHYEQF